MITYNRIANSSSKDFNLKRDNANVDGDSSMGKMLQFGSEGSKEFSKIFLIKPVHVFAHDSGEIHIHDLDFFAMGTLTCCQIDVMKLFKKGFSTGHGFIRTPNSISSYTAIAAIILQSNQNEQHGGQSIPNFDYAMAGGVKKTFKQCLIQNIFKFIDFNKDVEFDIINNLLLNFPIDLSVSSEKLIEMLEPVFKFSKEQMGKIIQFSLNDTNRVTFQAMEGLVHNLNTMHSRAGAQVPFTSLNFGTDTSHEGRLVIKAFLEATERGMGKGETPIFPISIFKVKEGVNFNQDDPNYDLFKLALKVSAKRLFPNFSFLDAPFNLQYYRANDYRSEVATMGCRTRVISSVFEESDGISHSRGNCSFTTINLPRIAIKNKGNWNNFMKNLMKK